MDNTTAYTIAAVERDTGLSKDVLRMWERRYGFPSPQRDANGERLYSAEQLERLRLIKRLMDQGHRPGRLIRTPPDALPQLSPRVAEKALPEAAVASLNALLELIKRHDGPAFYQAMQQQLAREGLFKFVLDTVAPLTTQVGEAWMTGRFEVFDEHLYTELTQRLLRQAMASLPAPPTRPRILLTTPPEEQHQLGILMAEALLTLEGGCCIALGTQTPINDIQRAATAHDADIVALSISSGFNVRQALSLLMQLRQLLPGHVALWAGGGAVERLPPLAGITLLSGLGEAVQALSSWRTQIS